MLVNDEIFNCLHKKVNGVLNICLDKLEMLKSQKKKEKPSI
jgi:hypothetical protein